jgi:large subunit ribosomal protein L13
MEPIWRSLNLYNTTMDYTIDANKKRLGRLATEISLILQGKKNPAYAPNKLGDRVLVKNYKNVSISGKKESQKIYYHHTGYVGHLKEETYEEIFAKNPKRVFREAVRRMLPKNRLNKERLKNLVFVENND